MKKERTKIFGILCFLILFNSKAQDFSFSVSMDSTLNYQQLPESVSLNSGNKWRHSYKIPLGFSFPFQGKAIDTVTFESNGFLVIDQQLNYALMAFNNFYCKTDSNSNYSSLSYQLSGEQGSGIFKLECRNIGQTNFTAECLSYQIWLRENGNIEFFMGPNTYEAPPGGSIIDTMQIVHIGLIKRDMDETERGVFISGNPSSPSSAPLNDEHPEIAYMRTIPKKGCRYIFIPNSN
jgi:hypothetical protein